jgi:hypothetical protein
MNSRISPWRIGRWSASATMIAAFGNDQTALVMYDTQTDRPPARDEQEA